MKRSINIEYTWWRSESPKSPIPKEHEELLDEHARTLISNMTDEGFTAGQLCETLTTEVGAITYTGWWTYKYVEVPDEPTKPIWRCTWCGKDTAVVPCEHCDNEMTVQDRTKPHHPEWSRHTAKEVECKICDRRGPYSIQQINQLCPGNPDPNTTT